MDAAGAIYLPSATGGSVRQGEIISDLVQIRLVFGAASDEQREVEPMIHPVAIVMSQDCDLDWDFKARQSDDSEGKKVPNILFCEMVSAHDLRHRQDSRGRQEINSEIWNKIKQNKDERYHFLQRIPLEQDALGQGLPELGIDFKRYFTIPTAELYYQLESWAHRRCHLQSPYLEHLSTRFGYYQFRVALPSDHYSE